jgi:hypothetical protein
MFGGNDFLHGIVLAFEGNDFSFSKIGKCYDDVVCGMYFEYPVFHAFSCFKV